MTDFSCSTGREPARQSIAEYICHRFLCAPDSCDDCRPGSVALEHADTILALSRRGVAQQLVGCGDPGCKDPNCTYGKDEDSYERGFRAGVEVSAAQASADPFVEAMAIENAKWDKGEPLAILDLYFAPWGAAKAARWESLTSDTPFDPEAVLRLIHEKLKAAPQPTQGGDKGEAVALVPLTEGGRPQWAETFGADDGCYIDYPEKWKPLYAAPQPASNAETEDLRKANQLLHALLSNREAEIKRLRDPAYTSEDSDDWKALAWDKVAEAHETRRAKTIEECARFLEASYPDHAWLNAACAAIRSLSVSSTDREGGK